jgi:hypothetical protein
MDKRIYSTEDITERYKLIHARIFDQKHIQEMIAKLEADTPFDVINAMLVTVVGDVADFFNELIACILILEKEVVDLKDQLKRIGNESTEKG